MHELLTAGGITPTEFDRLKAEALAGPNPTGPPDITHGPAPTRPDCPESSGRPDLPGESLRRIAVRFRQLNLIAVGYLGWELAIAGLGGAGGPGTAWPVLVLTGRVGLTLVIAALLVRLASELGCWRGVWLVLGLIPVVTLLAVLVLAKDATVRLRAAGVRVGFLGPKTPSAG